ncbi:MAG: methionyl-tRNA formyltransferase [Chitinophagaceae bacterium]|nr:methionyl-tRNA formyltransferase [Chitinophagaceae bacterium]
MGTPEFAVASLNALVEAGCNVVGVVTAPDKPAGRGMQLQQSAVKQYAVSKNIPVLQPEKLKAPAFLDELAALKADLQVVVAFRMLPEAVWNMPPMGTINVHGSLLPQYRGAAPINWAIINGESATGVTTFQLQHAIDTGNMLMQEVIPITDTMTAGELHDTMKMVGANLLVETIKGLVAGSIQAKPQHDAADLKHAPKLFTSNCTIDWHKPVHEVYNLVRGLSPYPGALTQLNGKILKIYRAEKIMKTVAETPGTFVSDNQTHIDVACTDGYLRLTEIQLEGKKKMAVSDFLRGNKI